MKKTLFILTIIALTACGSAKLLVPTQIDADRGAKIYPGLMLTELDRGKMLFEQNCGNCHGLKKPESRNEEKWHKVVPRMVEKVNKKAGKVEIGNEEQQLLLKYLITMSTAPPK